MYHWLIQYASLQDGMIFTNDNLLNEYKILQITMRDVPHTHFLKNCGYNCKVKYTLLK